MRVLALTKYGPLGASSRMRTYQYVPHLRDCGLEIYVAPLLGDAYVRSLYSGKRSLGGIALSYARRLRTMASAQDYDLVWVEKEALPWVPAVLEEFLLGGRAPVVVDYDDALFHRYDQHPQQVVRYLLGDKIDRVMRSADLVLAGNDYLMQRARRAGARRVEWLPTVVDLERYPHPLPRETDSGPVVVGWIGSPSTVPYLGLVSASLAALAEQGLVHCVAIGARPDQVAGTPFSALPWDEATEVETLRACDIGIMPLEDAPWERGKCGYKLIQYMACGLPVVASPVGVNAQLVEPGRNGFLAAAAGEWREAVEALARDRQLRARMGGQGRLLVEKQYCLQVQGPRLVSLLQSLNSGIH